jgi:hypothetical protein
MPRCRIKTAGFGGASSVGGTIGSGLSLARLTKSVSWALFIGMYALPRHAYPPPDSPTGHASVRRSELHDPHRRTQPVRLPVHPGQRRHHLPGLAQLRLNLAFKDA